MNTERGVVATKAIIIHEATVDKLSFDNSRKTDRRSVITVHDIFDTGTGPVIGAGKAMSDNDREMLRNHLNGEAKSRTGWWPENLLFQDSFQMVWYHPPAKRKMYFKRGAESQTIELWWPGLIMSYHIGKGFRIFSYAGSGRPTQSQKLYNAPLWNIYEDGRLCAGSASTASGVSEESMAVWDKAIFETNFTHANHDYLLASVKPEDTRSHGGSKYMKFIQTKAKTGQRFKASEMIATGHTLKSWAESL